MFDVRKPFFLRTLFKSFFLLGVMLFFANGTVHAQGPKKIKTIIVDAGHGGADPGAYAEYEGNLGSIEKNITLAITLKLVKILKEKMPDVNILPTRTTDITQSVREKADFANNNNGDLFVCIHADAVHLQTGSRIIGYKTENYTTTKHEGKGKKRKKVVTHHTREVPIKQYFKIPTKRKGTSTLILVARQTKDKIKAMENADNLYITDDTDSSLNIDHNSPEWKAIALVYSQLYFKKSYWLAKAVQEEVEKTGRNDLGVWQREKGIWILHATQMPAILIETGFLANDEDERYLASEKGQQELAEAIAKAIMRYRDMVDNPGGNHSSTKNP
jgi:N-acetylmuramoyl-L-alanine amidase